MVAILQTMVLNTFFSHEKCRILFNVSSKCVAKNKQIVLQDMTRGNLLSKIMMG